MMRVVKYDPNCPGKRRSRSSLGMQNKCKMRKRSDNQLKSIENNKNISPIMFHHVRVDEMSNNARLDQISQDAEARGGDGRKNQQSPLVIKTDPRYNNSQLEISMSNKKLNDYAGNKSKKLTFLPSISNRSPTPTATPTSQRHMESDKFSNLGVMNFKEPQGFNNYRNGLFELPSSLDKEFADERSHSGSEMGTSNKFANNDCLTGLPVFGRKFSSDVRLKLNKNNAQLQTIQGYSTCTFRVKMNGKNRTEHKDYE
ncbi:hypothetical protein ZYGR_0H02590 [Zygosaccharomyces rouxii]|uniref:Uncharacterized protein n=1 Tax=Zygosaccharomyces rouxii TaxID=4956 RepID=A0A1Q2ZVC2_ZYGRO|nr:hypothetical protein ZYGR_0H02590 [Zygosaccharomyces rouxii]